MLNSLNLLTESLNNFLAPYTNVTNTAIIVLCVIGISQTAADVAVTCGAISVHATELNGCVREQNNTPRDHAISFQPYDI